MAEPTWGRGSSSARRGGSRKRGCQRGPKEAQTGKGQDPGAISPTSQGLRAMYLSTLMSHNRPCGFRTLPPVHPHLLIPERFFKKGTTLWPGRPLQS